MKRALAGLVCLALAACAPAGGGKTGQAWKVYDGGKLVLTVFDRPGPLVSTAMPPPGAQPVVHAFLSGTAHSAVHEDQLRKILEASSSFADFIGRLRAAGFIVKGAE